MIICFRRWFNFSKLRKYSLFFCPCSYQRALLLLVRSIMRRRKARPGTTMRHVKFNKPISDWSSFRPTERRAWKFCNIARHFWSLSCGRRASWRTESSVILVCERYGRRFSSLIAAERRFARRNVCDSATEIPYWWLKSCPDSGQKRWLVDGAVTLF